MKHINKSILFAILAAGSIVAFTGCKKGFLDVNKDPNRVTDDNITPELIFSQAAVAVGDREVGGSAASSGAYLPTQWVQNWIGYMGGNGGFARDNAETAYDIGPGFGNTLFTSNYNTLFDLYLSKTKGLAAGDTALAGAAMVLSAKLMQEMVDVFGNIPYSQAFNIDGYKTPAYDKAQDIYAALQKSLDTGITYLSGKISKNFSNADVINHGDKTKWIKFANTLKLRLLIRQSQVAGFNPSAEITKIINKGGVLGAGESITVNPGYSNDVNKQNPFFANYGYTPTGGIATPGTSPNEYIIDILANNNDARIERFFTLPAGSNSYVGVAYGDEPGNLPNTNQASYFGPGLIGDSSAGGVFTKGASQSQWLYPSYESMFLWAEAVSRGWIPGNNNAKGALDDAITESFVWLKVPDAANEAAAYIVNNPTIADYTTVAGGTTSDKAKFIAFQKYIANACIDPLESYSDQRRLNFLPAGYITVNPGKLSNTLPVRLPYPSSEYTTNSANALKEGTINVFTSKIFWQP